MGRRNSSDLPMWLAISSLFVGIGSIATALILVPGYNSRIQQSELKLSQLQAAVTKSAEQYKTLHTLSQSIKERAAKKEAELSDRIAELQTQVESSRDSLFADESDQADQGNAVENPFPTQRQPIKYVNPTTVKLLDSAEKYAEALCRLCDGEDTTTAIQQKRFEGARRQITKDLSGQTIVVHFSISDMELSSTGRKVNIYLGQGEFATSDRYSSQAVITVPVSTAKIESLRKGDIVQLTGNINEWTNDSKDRLDFYFYTPDLVQSVPKTLMEQMLNAKVTVLKVPFAIDQVDFISKEEPLAATLIDSFVSSRLNYSAFDY